MQTPGQDLFRAILRAAKANIKSNYSDMGVKLNWNLENEELSGTFVIPIRGRISSETGEYLINSQDFADDPPSTSL